MILQPRDLDILQLCYEQQFLTVEHLLPLFKGGSRAQVMRRLRELREAGFVSTFKSRVGDCPVLVRLTKRGTSLAAARSDYTVPQVRAIDYATLQHDAIVTAVRMRLREHWDFTWLPERALKDRYEVIPDGVVQFQSGVAFAIEIENSAKGIARQRQLLESWDRVLGIHMVIFVATKPVIFDAWQRVLGETPRRMAYALLHWRELQKGTEVAWSPKGPLPLFARRSFG